MFLLVWLQSLRIKQSVCHRQSENFQLSLDFFSFVRGCEDKSHSSLKFAHMLERKNILNRKYRKNCGCCPVSLFIVRSLWQSCFEVLKTEGGSRNDCFFLLPLSSNFSKLWIFTSDHVWLLSSCKEPLTFVLKQGLIFQTWQNTVKHHRRCAASQNAQNILRKIGGDSMQFVWRNNTDAVQACWWQKLKKKNVGGTNWNYSGVVESVAWQQSDTMSVTLPGVQLLRLKDRAKIQEQYNCIK